MEILLASMGVDTDPKSLIISIISLVFTSLWTVIWAVHVRFRDGEAASDFNAALAEYRRYLQRAAEAAEMRAAAEAAGPPPEGPAGGGPSDQGSFRLKPGEMLRLPAVKVHGRPLPTICISSTMRARTRGACFCMALPISTCGGLQVVASRICLPASWKSASNLFLSSEGCDMSAPASTVFGPDTDSSSVTALQPRLSAPGLSFEQSGNRRGQRCARSAARRLRPARAGATATCRCGAPVRCRRGSETCH